MYIFAVHSCAIRQSCGTSHVLQINFSRPPTKAMTERVASPHAHHHCKKHGAHVHRKKTCKHGNKPGLNQKVSNFFACDCISALKRALPQIRPDFWQSKRMWNRKER